MTFLFDMDGVLINSEHLWDIHEMGFLKSLVGDSITKDVQHEIIGGSVSRTCKLLQERFGLDMTEETFTKKYIEFGLDAIYDHAELLPNVLELLNDLKEKNIPCALVSSSPYAWINRSLEKTGIRAYFAEIISADDIGGKGKPEPDIYLFAAKKMGVSPAECTVVEDSANGLLAAKRAGMRAIGIRNGVNDAQNFENADEVWQGIPKTYLQT